MYSAETTIVDVKQTGEEEYTLSMTAKELYVAAQSGDVLRRHDVSESDKAPEKKYVALSGVKFAEATGKYTFTFASGDVMETTSADAYPTSSSISDSTGGGSSGGVLVVTDTDGTLDKTWQEIHDAVLSGSAVISAYGGDALYVVCSVDVGKDYGVWTYNSDVTYIAASASGYPELQS